MRKSEHNDSVYEDVDTQRLSLAVVNRKYIKMILGDFPGSPVVKTSLSNAGDVGLISGWGAKIPQCLTAKKQNK